MCVLKQTHYESAAHIILSMAGAETAVNKLIGNTGTLLWGKIGEARKETRMKTLTFLSWLPLRSPDFEQVLPRDLGAVRRFCNVNALSCKGFNIWYHHLNITRAQ